MTLGESFSARTKLAVLRKKTEGNAPEGGRQSNKP